MTRFLGMVVFAGGFLLISSSLRVSALGVIDSVTTYTSLYSPYSYIVLAILVLAGITLTLRTGNQTVR